MKTKAYANHAPNKPFVPYTFERRTPTANDVSINIKYCGICHSDIHTARSEWGPTFYPCVPGHEMVGTITAIGSQVQSFEIGDTVGVGCMVGSCGSCAQCVEGLEQYCMKGCTWSYNSPTIDGDYTKGGYSDHIVVDENFVVRIPQNLNLAATAPLLCAGITTYSPLKYCGIGKTSNVAVLGLGGLGHMGVKLAASMGSEVTVLSQSPHKKDDAKRLGAHNFVVTSDYSAVASCANRFDVILDTVSTDHDLGQALSMIKRDGTLIMVGAAPNPLKLPVFSVISGRKKIMGSLIGGVAETQEMLDHCGKHNIVSDIELISGNQINEAYERILKSDVKYRFVIDCETLGK